MRTREGHPFFFLFFFLKKDNSRNSDGDLLFTFSNLNEPTAMKVTPKNPDFAQIESIDL